MSGRVNGNLVNVEAMVNAYFDQVWNFQNFNPSNPVLGENIAVVHVLDQGIDPGNGDPHGRQVDYDLLDRKGDLSLWRITSIWVNIFTPNPFGDPLLCGVYTMDNYQYIDPWPIHFIPGWGADPGCLANLWELPLLPSPLVMLAISNRSHNHLQRSMGSEYVIGVVDASYVTGGGEPGIGDIWTGALQQVPYDVLDINDASFQDVPNTQYPQPTGLLPLKGDRCA